LRILFLESHPMWIYGLPMGFYDLGHEVMISGSLIEGSLIDMLSSFKPDLIVSMGHTAEHSKEKQLLIKKYVTPTNIPLVYWATEDPGYALTFSLPLIKTIEPDFVFTICEPVIDVYKQHHLKAAHLDFGYHANVHAPSSSEIKYEAPLAIVANAYPMLYEQRPNHYRFKALRHLISPFLYDGIRIDFWGRYWDQMEPIINKKIPKEWIRGYIPYTEANKVYSSANIILGVQNHDTQLTQRTYEILGSGGLLLTNNTSEVRKLFTPGKDLLVSNSAEETRELVNYYLANEKQRKAIQQAGMETVRKYSYGERAKYIIETLVREGILLRSTVISSQQQFIHYEKQVQEEYEVHVIEQNETLWKIARKYGVSVEHIKSLNRMTSDVINVNGILKIKRK
jgi:spore maturation protein CgeB